MKNWHDAGCTRPDVRFQAELDAPVCESCGQLALLDNCQNLKPDGVGLTIPVAAPGQMHLSWPSAVKFVDQQEGSVGQTGNHAVKKNSPDVAALTHTGGQSLVYETLEGSDIRVMYLSPGQVTDPIHLHLKSVDLNNLKELEGSSHFPRYEALSYTWADLDGDASKNCSVYVGSRWDIMDITRNCHDALRRLRLDSAPRLLWVDAICIDQENLNERTHQVGLMQRIYASASRTLIYLGEGTGIESIDELCKRPYFSRIWVIQEIDAARSAQVLWGSQSMRWSTFHDQAVRVGAPWLRHFDRPRIREPSDLYKLLIDTTGCKMSDPRDRVYALLGIMPHSPEYGLIPDYSLAQESVFIGITAYLMASFPRVRLSILMAALATSLAGLPSWVPNWNSPAMSTFPVGSYPTSTYKPADPFDDLSIVRQTGALRLRVSKIYKIEPKDLGGATCCGYPTDTGACFPLYLQSRGNEPYFVCHIFAISRFLLLKPSGTPTNPPSFRMIDISLEGLTRYPRSWTDRLPFLPLKQRGGCLFDMSVSDENADALAPILREISQEAQHFRVLKGSLIQKEGNWVPLTQDGWDKAWFKARLELRRTKQPTSDETDSSGSDEEQDSETVEETYSRLVDLFEFLQRRSDNELFREKRNKTRQQSEGRPYWEELRRTLIRLCQARVIITSTQWKESQTSGLGAYLRQVGEVSVRDPKTTASPIAARLVKDNVLSIFPNMSAGATPTVTQDMLDLLEIQNGQGFSLIHAAWRITKEWDSLLSIMHQTCMPLGSAERQAGSSPSGGVTEECVSWIDII